MIKQSTLEIHILTAFPDMFSSPFEESIIKRAKNNDIISITTHNLRKWTLDKHKTIDARPYGGGAGMVMLLEPIYKAIKDIRRSIGDKKTLVILTSAKGEIFTQKHARNFSQFEAIILICGHYEGIDERVKEYIADVEISIGKYVLTGGEIPTMVIVDSVVRLIPGVLGNEESLNHESFTQEEETEAPQYTRPAEFVTEENSVWKVPDVLLSGNHQEINQWRSNQ
jgi:tRNA (guanine37-N1)-methyltransferase